MINFLKNKIKWKKSSQTKCNFNKNINLITISEQNDNEMESNWEEAVDSFDDLNLDKDLLRGIYAYGFEKPSPIQQKGILPLIKGKDTIAQAQSGTGKTATFAIGSLHKIDPKLKEVQALILAPTRELAQQIAQVNN